MEIDGQPTQRSIKIYEKSQNPNYAVDPAAEKPISDSPQEFIADLSSLLSDRRLVLVDGFYKDHNSRDKWNKALEKKA